MRAKACSAQNTWLCRFAIHCRPAVKFRQATASSRCGETRNVASWHRADLSRNSVFGPWIEDPDGNRIELMQTAPDSLQTKAIQRLRTGHG
jgi:hypothetical protein